MIVLAPIIFGVIFHRFMWMMLIPKEARQQQQTGQMQRNQKQAGSIDRPEGRKNIGQHDQDKSDAEPKCDLDVRAEGA